MSRTYTIRFAPVLLLTWLITGCAPGGVTASVPPATVILTPYQTAPATVTPPATLQSTPQQIFTPTPTPFIYIVQKDELVSAIALRFGVTLAQIQAANPGVDLNYPKANQQLVIPARELTPAAELSSPTPAVLTVKNIACYPDADGGGICFALMENNLPEAVMYITGEFVLQGDNNSRQAGFASLLDFLPAGAQIPVYARFDAPFPYPYQVDVAIHTALQPSSAQPTQPVTIADQSIEISADGLSAGVTGTIIPGGSKSANIAIVAAAYAGQNPVGIRRMEISLVDDENQPRAFEIWVYSASPSIDRVDIFVEYF